MLRRSDFESGQAGLQSEPDVNKQSSRTPNDTKEANHGRLSSVRKHTIKRRQRQAVYLSIAAFSLLIAFIGIMTVNVSSDSTYLNITQRDLWSAVSVMVDGVETTSDSWLAPNVESRDLPSPFITIVALTYKFVGQVFHFSLSREPITTTRIILVMINLPLLMIFFAATVGCIEKVGSTNWSRYCGCVITCGATALLPLSCSLSYQLPAAAATAVTLWLYFFMADRLEHSHLFSQRLWAIAGFTAGMAGVFHFYAAFMILPWLVLFAYLDYEEAQTFVGGLGLAFVFLCCSVAVGVFMVDQSPPQETQAYGLATPEAELQNNTAIGHPSVRAVNTEAHSLIGHHSLLWLTPVWLILPFAIVRGSEFEPAEFRRLTIAVVVVSLLCVLTGAAMRFGGYTDDTTQIFLSHTTWITPLWLLMLTPKIEEWGNSMRGKYAVLALTMVSVTSAVLSLPSIMSVPWTYLIWPL